MAVRLANLVHGQDVRVVQGGRGDSLALEALTRRGIDVAAKHLDRDWSVEPCITGAIDQPGAPFADQGFDLVGSDVGAGGNGRGGLRAGLYVSRRTSAQVCRGARKHEKESAQPST
jgi:uncharacterized protein with LGFP repeats